MANLAYTYCISDLHGCYDEFTELLELIKFDDKRDKVYILGDAIDRGSRSVDCLLHIMNTKGMYLLLGNHEKLMLNFFASEHPHKHWKAWKRNGGEETACQLDALDTEEQFELIEYVWSCPSYKTLKVGEKRFFLSHAGLDASKPFNKQDTDDLLWGRESFYTNPAKSGYTCVFGHTPIPKLRKSLDCSVWFDNVHNDKICIDSGCVYGGALAALRLNDMEVFYVKSHGEKSGRFKLGNVATE